MDERAAHTRLEGCIRVGGDLCVLVEHDRYPNGRRAWVVRATDSDGNPLWQLGVFTRIDLLTACLPGLVDAARQRAVDQARYLHRQSGTGSQDGADWLTFDPDRSMDTLDDGLATFAGICKEYEWRSKVAS